METTLTIYDLVSMVLLGLFGLGHCVGMCGPLIVAFPVRVGTPVAHVWYHVGRVVTYTVVGAILGGIGGALGSLGTVAYVQVAMGGVASVFMLLFGLTRIGLVEEPKLLQVASPSHLPGFGRVMAATRSKRAAAMLPVGLFMGFLPCGLSYAAFAKALPSGGVLHGALLVAAFGLGTLPGLVLLGTAASTFLRKHRALSDVLAGVLMIAMAVDLGADVIGAIL